VGTVKHHVHDFDIDVPGKDSWRHARAGAVVSMISSPSRFGLTRTVDTEPTLDELGALAAANGAEILVTEGYKSAARVRIEVSRRARSDGLISTAEELFAVVTDQPEVAPAGVPVLGLDDIAALADLVEATFLAGGEA
jgi:molybdopterin-guanine dinucleotide biosynthesis protein MobB